MRAVIHKGLALKSWQTWLLIALPPIVLWCWTTYSGILDFDNEALDTGITIVICLCPLLSYALVPLLGDARQRILAIVLMLPFVLFGALNFFLATEMPQGMVPYDISHVATIQADGYEVTVEKLDHGVLGEAFGGLQKRRVLPGLSITRWLDLAGMDSETAPEIKWFREDRVGYRARATARVRPGPWRVIHLKRWLYW